MADNVRDECECNVCNTNSSVSFTQVISTVLLDWYSHRFPSVLRNLFLCPDCSQDFCQLHRWRRTPTVYPVQLPYAFLKRSTLLVIFISDGRLISVCIVWLTDANWRLVVAMSLRNFLMNTSIHCFSPHSREWISKLSDFQITSLALGFRGLVFLISQ